jgi:hypothetical protein
MPDPCAGVLNNPWCPLNPTQPNAAGHGVERPDARLAPQPVLQDA